MSLNATLLIQMTVFAVVVLFSMKFIWPMIMEAIEQRNKDISDGLAAAEQGQKKLSDAESEVTGLISEAKKQATTILDQANTRATSIVQTAKNEGSEERDKIISSAQEEAEQELNKLKDIVKKYDLFLFSDEVYREFCYDGNKPLSTMQLDGLEQNVVMIDSVSKRYSMCGARVGMLISKNKDVIGQAIKFAQARLSPPTLGQIAGEAALETPQSYFDNVKAEYSTRRDILIDGLNKIDGVFCPNPGGAFYAVAKLPVDDSEKFCQWILESFSHNGATVMMAPAAGFYASQGLGKQEVRLAYVLNTNDLKLAIEVLSVAIKEYQNTQM